MQHALERPELDADGIRALLREATAGKIALDATTLEYRFRKRIEHEAAVFAANPSDFDAALRLIKLLDLIPSLPFSVVLWEAQNLVYRPLLTAYQQNGWHQPNAGPVSAQRHEELNHLANQLHILLPQG